MSGIAIGKNTSVTHENSIVLGSDISSDHDFQIKIGDGDVSKIRNITAMEFNAFRDALNNVTEGCGYEFTD